MEHLKQIEGYPDYYVSDQGNVYSNKSGVMKKLKPIIKNSEYLAINLSNKVNFTQIGIHRLVAQAFIPNPDNKPCVNHKDGDKQNNNVNNLEWVTHKENSQYFQNVQKPNGLYNSSEEINAYRKRWREEHREELKAYRKRWREEHKKEI